MQRDYYFFLLSAVNFMKLGTLFAGDIADFFFITSHSSLLKSAVEIQWNVQLYLSVNLLADCREPDLWGHFIYLRLIYMEIE